MVVVVWVICLHRLLYSLAEWFIDQLLIDESFFLCFLMFFVSFLLLLVGFFIAVEAYSEKCHTMLLLLKVISIFGTSKRPFRGDVFICSMLLQQILGMVVLFQATPLSFAWFLHVFTQVHSYPRAST